MMPDLLPKYFFFATFGGLGMAFLVLYGAAMGIRALWRRFRSRK